MKRNRASVAFAGIFSLVISASLAAAPLSALAASDSKFLDPFKGWPVPEAGETAKPETSAKPEATTDTAKPGKTDTSASTQTPSKPDSSTSTDKPAKPEATADAEKSDKSGSSTSADKSSKPEAASDAEKSDKSDTSSSAAPAKADTSADTKGLADTAKSETSAKAEAPADDKGSADADKSAKSEGAAATETPAKSETAANAQAAAATAEPEVQIVAVEDLEALCRGKLTYGNSNASVLGTDNLRIVASEGDVWVIQWGPGGVVTPDPAQKSTSSTDSAPLDLSALGVPELAAIRAAALASQLDGALVENGDLTSAAKTAEELAAAKQEAPKDAATDAAGKDGKATDAPKPPAVKTLTWIALDVWGNPGSAFVYEFKAADAADQTKSGDATTAQSETKPAKQNAVAALIAADGRWSLEEIWSTATDSGVKAAARVSGVVPYTPEGLPLCDWVWYVDKAAWDEKVWVVDTQAWDEQRFVETGQHLEGANTWTCPSCGIDFWDLAEADAHFSTFIGLYYGYIQSSGDPVYPWMCTACGGMFENYELASEHMYYHAEQHECYQSGWNYWVVDGYTETVHHDATGHWETVHHAEEGHWGYPEGIAPKTK